MIRPLLVVKIYRQSWRLANERAAVLAARPRASVPELLWSAARPAAHAAFRYLPGPTLVAAPHEGQLRNVLDYLDLVHAVPGDRFGRIAGPGFDTWARYLVDRLAHYRTALLAQGQPAPAAIAAALMSGPPPGPGTPRLIHNDPNPGNFICSRGSLVGIDWELASYGDPALDTARAAWEWGVENHSLRVLAAERGVDADVLRYYQALHALGRLVSAIAPARPDSRLAARCLDTLAVAPRSAPITIGTPAS
jgi:aminoglycoside phosphotransferase (APT) family kinase protein